MNLNAFIATTRFGLGPAMGEMEKIQSDPRGWLKKQVESAHIPAEIAGFTKNKEAEKEWVEWRRAHKTNKDVEKGLKKIEEKVEKKKEGIKDLYIGQTTTRFNLQVKTAQPFIERLTMFWSNHFTISGQRASSLPYLNQFEGEAIRPYVNGDFADMLIAVTKHPGMLLYLDNAQSTGPNSQRGKGKKKGLNENLGREILELHTLGVNGGYKQDDVIALAKIITGWSINNQKGNFEFHDSMHEPGAKTLLGKTYPGGGMAEGEQALRDLAAHPSTARHIATKLARHFIADDPPESAVAKLADAYTKTGGSLKAVNLALIDMKECWESPLAKIKTPYEFLLSACRLIGVTMKPTQLMRSLASLNYQVFNASSPAGYPDTASAWVSSDSIVKRVEWSQTFAEGLPAQWKPLELAEQAYGPVMREETKFVINGAASGKDGLAFVFSSPEFQRR